jgi:hypothetical protein
MDTNIQGIYYFISAIAIIVGLLIGLMTTYLRLYVKNALSEQTEKLSSLFMSRELFLEKVGHLEKEITELREKINNCQICSKG